MPEFYYFKTFEKDSIADGGTYEDYWWLDEDVTIKRVFIRSKDGTELAKSTFWFEFPGRVFARPIVPAATLGEDVLVTPVLDIKGKSGDKLSWTFKNLEGATKSIFITFEIWKE